MNTPMHDESVKGISELIRERAHDLGATYRELEARSERAGFKVKYQTFAQLATSGPKAWPKEPETIKGIASALQVTEESVVLAFAATFGLNISRKSQFSASLPLGVDRLNPQVRDSFLRLIRDVLETEGSGEHAVSSTADEHAAGSAVPENKDEVALAARRGVPDQLPDTDYDDWGA